VDTFLAIGHFFLGFEKFLEQKNENLDKKVGFWPLLKNFWPRKKPLK